MSFLKRTIRNAVSQGISRGLGEAIGKAVQQAVEPKATEYANKAADRFDQAAGNAAQQTRQATSGLEGAFANLERSMQSYANQMTRDLKVCPECGQPTSADKKFCPGCGAKLPEQTLGESAVCPACGKQNSVGTKFCQDCGTKLPIAIAEEQAKQAKDAQELAQWDNLLPGFPKWNCGGSGYNLEEYEPGIVSFSAGFGGNSVAAQRAVEQYRQVLLQNGFQQAGQYPSMNHLYKKENGQCLHVDTEHCFESDADRAYIGFDHNEPYGGFDYVKPEPKKSKDIDLNDLKELRNLFRR